MGDGVTGGVGPLFLQYPCDALFIPVRLSHTLGSSPFSSPTLFVSSTCHPPFYILPSPPPTSINLLSRGGIASLLLDLKTWRVDAIVMTVGLRSSLFSFLLTWLYSFPFPLLPFCALSLYLCALHHFVVVVAAFASLFSLSCISPSFQHRILIWSFANLVFSTRICTTPTCCNTIAKRQLIESFPVILFVNVVLCVCKASLLLRIVARSDEMREDVACASSCIN